MLTACLILLAAAEVTWGLECIVDCSLRAVPFGEEIRIRAAQCPRRVTAPTCTIDVTVNFDRMQYTANFAPVSKDSESIFISLNQPLDYSVTRQCSTDNDCAIRGAQSRVSELTGRPYNATALYGEIAPFIRSPLARDPIKCFDANSTAITCALGQICSIKYDPIARRVRSRGCVFGAPIVSVYGSPTDASFDINCKSELCNNEETYEQIKRILNRNDLVDANGGINTIVEPDGC